MTTLSLAAEQPSEGLVSVARRHGGLSFLFAELTDGGFGRQHQARNRGGILQRRPRHLGRIDNASLDEILVYLGSGVEAVVGLLGGADLLDNDGPLDSGILGDPAERLFQRAAHDPNTGLLVGIFELQLVESFGDPQQANPAPGNDPFLNSSAGGVHGVFDAGFLFLHLGFGCRAHLDDGDAANELGEPLLQLLAIVVGRGVLDLRP